MKNASIATFLAVAACSASTGSAYERELSDERRLGMGKYSGDASGKFAKYVDIYNRCCDQTFETLDSDDSPCKCPVRTFKGWGGWWDIYSKWEDKCETKIKDKSDIISLAQANGFTELVNLLVPDRLDLVETLKSDNDGKGWTVFSAFAALLEAIPDVLENRELVDAVLKYHVIEESALKSDDLSNGQVATLNGKSIMIDTTDGVKINAANVIVPFDVEVSNGVVHAIDKVLIPPSE
eukprot:CAMPEP_0181069914 /NCGR_PEP_ID=MMETSP1070-20121207/27203_1 /TAXON_ID=265543 /ORGANISM="Minutocellus polymorphus, Strain NH13" /LENGTH=236 /DNA_ID=CAMNT_0023150757 /DNA_START=126 /DNA_END=836 /DNA_ORIENTATION=+